MFGRLLTVSAQRLITLHKDKILVIHGTCVNWTRFSYTGRCTMLSSWTYNNDNDKIFLNNNNNGSMQVHNFTVNYIRLKQRFLECKHKISFNCSWSSKWRTDGQAYRLYKKHLLLWECNKTFGWNPSFYKTADNQKLPKKWAVFKKKAQTHINSLLNFTEP